MNKDAFLTRRWNNILSAGLGVPLLTFVAAVLFTSVFTDLASFVGIAIAGAFY